MTSIWTSRVAVGAAEDGITRQQLLIGAGAAAALAVAAGIVGWRSWSVRDYW